MSGLPRVGCALDSAQSLGSLLAATFFSSPFNCRVRLLVNRIEDYCPNPATFVDTDCSSYPAILPGNPVLHDFSVQGSYSQWGFLYPPIEVTSPLTGGPWTVEAVALELLVFGSWHTWFARNLREALTFPASGVLGVHYPSIFISLVGESWCDPLYVA